MQGEKTSGRSFPGHAHVSTESFASLGNRMLGKALSDMWLGSHGTRKEKVHL